LRLGEDAVTVFAGLFDDDFATIHGKNN
jgi:hypothetical protein